MKVLVLTCKQQVETTFANQVALKREARVMDMPAGFACL